MCATIHRAVPLLCKLLIAYNFQGMLRFLKGKFIFSVLANGQTTSTVKNRSFMQSPVHMVCMTCVAFLYRVATSLCTAIGLHVQKYSCGKSVAENFFSTITIHNCNLIVSGVFNLIVSGVLQQRFSATHLSHVNLLFRKNMYHSQILHQNSARWTRP